jgi:hypothetical protein
VPDTTKALSRPIRLHTNRSHSGQLVDAMLLDHSDKQIADVRDLDACAALLEIVNATVGPVQQRDDVLCPEDYTFGSINVFVHHDDVNFCELQWALLGIATEHEKVVRERDGLRRAIDQRLRATEALIARGKGVWPERSYVRDEQWACWQVEVMSLKSILFAADHYNHEAEAALATAKSEPSIATAPIAQ